MRTIAQRYFDPRPGAAIDDAGGVADALLSASDQEILAAAGVQAQRPYESSRDAAGRVFVRGEAHAEGAPKCPAREWGSGGRRFKSSLPDKLFQMRMAR